MNRIRELRTELGMTQTDLAEKLQVKTAAVSKYESGKVSLVDDTIIRLATLFNVSTDYLLGYSNNRKYNESLAVVSRDLHEDTFLKKVGSIIYSSLDEMRLSDGSVSDENLAHHFGISCDLFGDICQGNVWPPLDFLEAVSAYCNKSTDYLLGLREKNREQDLDNNQLFRFNRISRARLKALMEKNDYSWNYELGFSDTELYLLTEYGFVFHFQIIEKICDLLHVSSDYLLGRIDESDDKLITISKKLNLPYKEILIGRAREFEIENMHNSVLPAFENVKATENVYPSSGTEGHTVKGA